MPAPGLKLLRKTRRTWRGSAVQLHQRPLGEPVINTPLHYYLFVALGSGAGGAARLFVSTLVSRGAGTQFPWGTLAVNVIGCLLVGALGALFEPASPLHVRPDLRVLLVVGVLGGFTTFSAFSLEALLLVQRGAHVAAVSYVVASVALCLAAAAGSYMLVHSMLR